MQKSLKLHAKVNKWHQIIYEHRIDLVRRVAKICMWWWNSGCLETRERKTWRSQYGCHLQHSSCLFCVLAMLWAPLNRYFALNELVVLVWGMERGRKNESEWVGGWVCGFGLVGGCEWVRERGREWVGWWWVGGWVNDQGMKDEFLGTVGMPCLLVLSQSYIFLQSVNLYKYQCRLKV